MNTPQVNMGNLDRLASLMVGAGLLQFGVRRFSATRALTAAAGTGLILRGATGRCPVYQATGINTKKGPGKTSEIRSSVTLLKEPEEVFSFFTDFDRLQSCLKYISDIEKTGENRYRWTLNGPGPIRIAGETELSITHPRRVEWHPTQGSRFPFSGSVEIEPIEFANLHGSIVRIQMTPDGALGKAAMGGRRVLEQLTFEGLARMKQLLEAGEIATTEGQPSGRRSDRRKISGHIEESRKAPFLPEGLRRDEIEVSDQDTMGRETV